MSVAGATPQQSRAARGTLELAAPLYLFVLTLRFNTRPVPIGADDQLSHDCWR
jgi:hypothetical protein